MSGAQAVDPAQLGLTSEQLAILQQGQNAVAGGSSSSRAASRASSQGLLLLDSSSLAALGRHFDSLMQGIQQQLQYLTAQTEAATMQMYDQSGAMMANADAEIARYHRLLEQMEELDEDFDRISSIRDIVRDFRKRAQEMERELERSQPSGSSSRHRDGKQKHSGSSRRDRH